MVEHDLLTQIFNASVEYVRETIRDSHLYGCAPTKKDICILRNSPSNWSDNYRRKLEKLFCDECVKSQLIIADDNELQMAFEEFFSEN